MISPDRAAAPMIHLERKRGANLQHALLDRADVDEHIAEMLLRVGDLESHTLTGQRPGVADLAAGFAIERGLIEDYPTAVALLQLGDLLAVLHQRSDYTRSVFGLVAREFGSADLFAQSKPDGPARGPTPAPARGARLAALFFHCVVERRKIDANAPRPECILRQIK